MSTWANHTQVEEASGLASGVSGTIDQISAAEAKTTGVASAPAVSERAERDGAARDAAEPLRGL